jgi:hypothetical protein
VKGTCKDAQGNPIADAIVIFANLDNGQKYQLKTNKKGEYFSLGLTPGKYNVSLYKTADDMKANKPLDFVKGFPVQLDENTLDFDQKKEQEKQARGEGLTPEQLKAMTRPTRRSLRRTTIPRSPRSPKPIRSTRPATFSGIASVMLIACRPWRRRIRQRGRSATSRR